LEIVENVKPAKQMRLFLGRGSEQQLGLSRVDASFKFSGVEASKPVSTPRRASSTGARRSSFQGGVS